MKYKLNKYIGLQDWETEHQTVKKLYSIGVSVVIQAFCLAQTSVLANRKVLRNRKQKHIAIHHFSILKSHRFVTIAKSKFGTVKRSQKLITKFELSDSTSVFRLTN